MIFVLSYRYSSLGEVQKPPFFKDGTLQIEYQDGALCTQNITTPHVKTTIYFKCDLEAKVWQQLITKGMFQQGSSIIQ